MKKDVVKEAAQPSIPGTGIAGRVICPFLSIAGRDVDCRKAGCELWVELAEGPQDDRRMVGRCCLAWNTLLSIETRMAIDKMVNSQKKGKT